MCAASCTGRAGNTTSLPLGPRLPMLVQTLLFGRYRHRWLPALRRRYGDTVLLRIAPRSRRLVLLARPDDIHEAFLGSTTTFHAGKGNAILGPLVGPHSVMLLDEDDHLKVRKQLMPAFNGSALRGYRDLVADITREQIADWPIGRLAPLHPRMRAVTLEVILRVVFGVTDQSRLAVLRPLVERIVSVSPLIMLAGYYPKLRDYGPWRRHLEAQLRLDELLYAEIAERRAAESLQGRRDVLSRLLTTPDSSLSDKELRDQLVTLLLAGHETTATALAWALHELARGPGALATAQRAADEQDDAYLNAVAKESLRLHPVIYETSRVLTEPAEVAGYRLPAGVTVMPLIGIIQSDSEHYPRPQEFRPERFLAAHPPSSHVWLPFGGGVRRCLGAAFSLMESEVILREVLTRFDVRAETLRPEPVKPRNVTLAPGRGTRATLTDRAAAVV